ncbi:MAG: hypothetical protein BroJett025_10010 [Patescibacteria group bacterium]|nr:MAG: hypothetical protein BroJett025_10010 [Patescibacteria group bacterium]
MQEASPNPNVSTAKKRREIATVLNQFYMNPVAKASTELFLTVGLVLFLGAFAIRPTILTMSNLLKEIETKKELDASLTKKIAALQTAQTQYVSIENELEVLNEAIPEQPDIILGTKLIEKMAADNRVVINSLSISDLPEDSESTVLFTQKSKQLLNISIRITGDYVSIREFVEALRNSRKSFVVESVVFALEEDRGNKKLGANITVGTPYFGVADPTEQTAKK